MISRPGAEIALRMKFLLLFIALVLGLASARAETMQQWVDAAPKADVVFTPWQPAENHNQSDETGTSLRLSQGLYGYLNLAKLPAAEFPLRVRLLYNLTAADSVTTDAQNLARPKPGVKVETPRFVEERRVNSPGDAGAVPVWNAPYETRRWQSPFEQNEEVVRLEVVGQGGTVLARQTLGASARDKTVRRSLAVNSPDVMDSFQQNAYDASANVASLAPDDYTLANVNLIWIDHGVTVDPALTDAYWRRVLLGGTTVAGKADDIGALANRLGLNPNEPVVSGRLLACDSSADMFKDDRVESNNPNGVTTNSALKIATETNPFYFSVVISQDMNAQLVSFSRWYLGIFIVLQAVLIFFAFAKVRGARRVWLWLIIPLFAILYALGGAFLAHFLVSDRAEAMIDQIEQQHAGWPEALVLTHLSHVDLVAPGWAVHLPADSRPATFIDTEYVPDAEADVTFQHGDASGSLLSFTALPARREMAYVRSWIPASAPIEMSVDGKAVTAKRGFKGAWLWDGTGWRDLGPLQLGQTVALANAKMFSPGIVRAQGYRAWEDFNDFPGFLKPLLTPAATTALQGVNECLFFGVGKTADCTFDGVPPDRLYSRRVVAYQFPLPKATP
jgi:hypothetical protein